MIFCDDGESAADLRCRRAGTVTLPSPVCGTTLMVASGAIPLISCWDIALYLTDFAIITNSVRRGYSLLGFHDFDLHLREGSPTNTRQPFGSAMWNSVMPYSLSNRSLILYFVLKGLTCSHRERMSDT